jgi:hypothetical protein
MAKIYCDDCFETCTGKEPTAAPGICRACGHSIVTAVRDPHEQALPYTAEDRAWDRGFERKHYGE